MIKNLFFAALMALGMGGIAQACDACNGTAAVAHTCAVNQSYQTVSVVSPQTVQYAPTALVAQDACDNHAVSAAVVTTTATPVVVAQPVVTTNAYVRGTQRVVVGQHVGAVNGYSGNAFVTGNAYVRNNVGMNAFGHNVVHNVGVRANAGVRHNVGSSRGRGLLGNVLGGKTVTKTKTKTVTKSR